MFVKKCTKHLMTPSLYFFRPDSSSPLMNGEVKEEPRDYHGLPPGFPPYYLHPGKWSILKG
jgi:hypothetical protein